MPKAKGGKGKKKRNVLQVTVPRSSNRSPNKDAKTEKVKEQSSVSVTTTENTVDPSPLETRSKRTPKPRKIVDISPAPKARSSKPTSTNKAGSKKNKRGSTVKKDNAGKGKGGKSTATTRAQASKPKGKRKRPPPKKASKPAKQVKQDHDVSDSGEDIPLHGISKSHGDSRGKQSSRSSKRLKIEEEELQEELAPLPPESEEEEEEVDEEEDEVDDSLFFGLPPEKSLDEQDGLREPETYSCSHCREKFKKEDLPEHLAQCPDRYVQCRECGKVLSNLQTLERHHKRFHLKIREVPCTLCEKMFIDEAAARKHLKTVHFKVKNFHCPHCDKAFSQRNKLTYHVRTHSGEKPYSCTECGRSFSLLWNLKTHMRTHTGEKPYACDICGRQFTQKQNMTSHMTTHRKPKPDRRTFPGLTGNDLNGSGTTYNYENSPRNSVSGVKTQSSPSKQYSLSNVLKTNYISTSKPVLQGIGQQYLLDDVASVVDIPGRPEGQTKITTQTSLGAATAQINQSLLNQQVLGHQSQTQLNVETGLGLLSAVARKGDESNVQVDGIVSLEQNQQSSTGNPSLDQVVEVFLQSNVTEGTGDSFIPSMVGAETMVSTSEMEHDAAAVVDPADHQALLSGDHVSGEKLGDDDSSANKQMVGQITAQTVIPVDQANLAGLANILQNPEILAAINAASSSNKFIVIGPVGMFSGQQTGTTSSSTVTDAPMPENMAQSFSTSISSAVCETSDPAAVQSNSVHEIPESFKVEEAGMICNDIPQTQAASGDESKPQVPFPENMEHQTVVPSDGDVDHKYVQEEARETPQNCPEGDQHDSTSNGNVIQIPSSFTKAIAGMGSRITTNNISDVTAALINEIQGQIQLQGTKDNCTENVQRSSNPSYSVNEAENSSLPNEVSPTLDGAHPDSSRNLNQELQTSSEELIHAGQQEQVSTESNNSSHEDAKMDPGHFKLPETGSLTESIQDGKESAEAICISVPSTEDLGSTSSHIVATTVTASEMVSNHFVTMSNGQGMPDNLISQSTTDDASGTVYLSQLPDISSEQIPAEAVVTGHFHQSTGTTEGTVVVNSSVVQSLLNNINIPNKQVDDNGDFPVIDISTGNYLGTSNMLNSVPVTGTGLDVTIEHEQLASSGSDVETSQIILDTTVTLPTQLAQAGGMQGTLVTTTNSSSESIPESSLPPPNQSDEVHSVAQVTE